MRTPTTNTQATHTNPNMEVHMYHTDQYDNPMDMLDTLLSEEAYMEMVREEEADKERARLEKEYDKHMDRYFKDISIIESDEDYLRVTYTAWDTATYDGNEYEGIWDTVYKEATHTGTPITDLRMLDKKVRKSAPINVLKLIAFLADAKRTRDLVYNNTWGICVRPAKKANYPMHTVLDSIKDIVVEGLSYLSGKEKETALLYIDSAPMDSLLAKAWDRMPTVTLDPVYADIKSPECDGVWEKCLVKISTSDDENLTETIPAEDVDFWRSIYATRKDLTVGIEYEVN